MLETMSTVFCVGSKPPSQRVRVAIRWPRVRVPLWPLARLWGFAVPVYSVHDLGQNRGEICTPPLKSRVGKCHVFAFAQLLNFILDLAGGGGGGLLFQFVLSKIVAG